MYTTITWSLVSLHHLSKIDFLSYFSFCLILPIQGKAINLWIKYYFKLADVRFKKSQLPFKRWFPCLIIHIVLSPVLKMTLSGLIKLASLKSQPSYVISTKSSTKSLEMFELSLEWPIRSPVSNFSAEFSHLPSACRSFNDRNWKSKSSRKVYIPLPCILLLLRQMSRSNFSREAGLSTQVAYCDWAI